MDEKQWKIYCLKDPEDNSIRYIGITKRGLEKRYKEHMSHINECSPHKRRWIDKLIRNKLMPKIEIIEENLSEDEAKEGEMKYIAFYRNIIGKKLLNITNGGDAVMAGRKHSKETIDRMKEDRIKEGNSFFGKKHSYESRKKMSDSLMGRTSWSKGKKFTEEHRRNMSLANIGRRVHNTGKTRFPVERIRVLYTNGMSQVEIAKLFSTNQGTISDIVRKKKSYTN